MKAVKKFLYSIIFLTLTCSSSYAQISNYIRGTGNPFKLNPVLDSVLIGTGAALTITPLCIEKFAAPKNTIYDNQPLSVTDINKFDSVWMNPYSKGTDITGDVAVGLSLASPLILAAAPKEDWICLVTMYGESILISNGIKWTTKLCTFRPRPYMYFENPCQKDIDSGDWCSSFPSGHTTFAFTSATFLSYTFCKLFPDSKWKYAVTAASYSLAAGTAVLRIMSGNHFMTDVITGALIGSAAGFLVPFLHTINYTTKNKDEILLSAAPQGFSVNIAFH